MRCVSIWRLMVGVANVVSKYNWLGSAFKYMLTQILKESGHKADKKHNSGRVSALFSHISGLVIGFLRVTD